MMILSALFVVGSVACAWDLWQKMSDLTVYSTVAGNFWTAAEVGVVTAVIYEVVQDFFARTVASLSVWERMKAPQKIMARNFGYPEDVTDDTLADMFGYSSTICIHHTIAGSLCLPCIIYGWEASGFNGQFCFFVAVMMDLGFDMYDWLKKFWSCVFSTCPLRPTWSPCPAPFFVVMCILHHPMAMMLIVPLNVKYPQLNEYHYIACSLLLAAGVCFLLGNWKFTLNTQSKSGFYTYKVIVVLQFITVIASRIFIWFYSGVNLLIFLYRQQDWPYFSGAAAGAILMTLFNLVLVSDSTQALIKWLPRSPPSTSEEQEELHHAMARSVSGYVSPAILLRPRRQVRVAAKAVVAAQKFKKPLLNHER
eukprot:TRINITY_DN122872_c0_g1_i1.p1 TRINITY_DN122872_c0_g1~~TRINITY_DN122872_c0_g1_i1.p1  ORF type:complete len:365 (+),score=64.71 TRINITY_DN122872_c0_g1_i1:159-1253(+)